MKALWITLVMLVAVSCQSSQSNLTVEQCTPFMAFVDVEINGEVRSMVEPADSSCWCRGYFYGKNKIGPKTGESTPVRKPLAYCQNLVGNPPADYAEMTTFFESVRQKIKERSR